MMGRSMTRFRPSTLRNRPDPDHRSGAPGVETKPPGRTGCASMRIEPIRGDGMNPFFPRTSTRIEAIAGDGTNPLFDRIEAIRRGGTNPLFDRADTGSE